MQFEWDDAKARSNLVKHDVSFEQARWIFADPYLLSTPDDEHSDDEDREISLGIVPWGEPLVVVHTVRWHGEEEHTRIISARRADLKEEMLYYSRGGAEMKDHYDFSKAVQGKYTRPKEELKLPIYLDPEVEKGLEELSRASGKEIRVLANALLQKDLELLKAVTR